MSDLIDRQAILKHIEKIRQGVRMMDDTHRASIIMNGMYLCEKAVRNQPSAQPEPIRLRLDHELSKEEYERLKKDCAEQPIILLPKESAQPEEDIRAMCGECDAWNQYKNHPQPGWIPCSRELPKKDGQYIVTVKYEHVDGYEDIYSEHGEWVDGHWDAEFGHCGRVEKVLAWQPLPIPYREGGKETDGEA